MSRQTVLTFIVFTVVSLCATMFATQQMMARRRLQTENTQLHATVDQQEQDRLAAAEKLRALQQSADQAARESDALRQQLANQTQAMTRIQDQASVQDRDMMSRTNCRDSDAKLGADAIFVGGYIEVGNSRSYDKCRGNQLVEFVCIENPHGSGRWLPDAKMINCPAGSRCVSGECLRP